MRDIYGGDYDVQYTDLYPDFDDGSDGDDEWWNFDAQAVMDYDEYVDFCNRWYLNRKYSDKGVRYMIVLHVTPHVVRKSNLSDSCKICGLVNSRLLFVLMFI